MALSRIQDTLYTPSGALSTGTIWLEWPDFTASDGHRVPAGNQRVTVVDGKLDTYLEPSTTATPAFSYTVRYSLYDTPEVTKYWNVGAAGPYEVADIEAASAADLPTQIPSSQVTFGSKGDILYGDESGAGTSLNIGSEGEVLQVSGDGIPDWGAIPAHTHTEANITSLTADLAGKAASTHGHAESDITDLVSDLAGKAAVNHTHEEAGAHTHAEADVTSLVTDLANKATKGANSDITSLSGLSTPLSVAQGGTGGATTLAAKAALNLNAVFDVHDYGAVGDGSTDDAGAIQAAIDAAQAAGGGTVLFHGHTYKVTAGLNVTASFVSLRGVGFKTIIDARYDTTDPIIDFDGASSTRARCELHDLSIWSGNATHANQIAVRVYNQNSFTATNVYVAYVNVGFLIDHASSYIVRIRDSAVHYLTPATGVGVDVQNGANIWVTGCNVAPDATQPLAGIRLVNCGGTRLIQNECLSTGTGLLVVPGAGQSVDWTYSIGNMFDSGTGRGIYINPDTGGTVKGFSSAADWCGTFDLNGVDIAGSGTVDGVLFTGCQSQNNKCHGFMLSASPVNVSFTNCKASGNSSVSAGTYCGLYVAAGAQKFQVIGGVYGQSDNYSATQKYGIRVVDGASDYYQIIEPKSDGNLTAGVADGGSGTNKRVQYGSVLRCRAYTNQVISVSDTAWTPVPLELEDYDLGGFHDNSTNNTRVTIPVGGGGTYMVVGGGSFANSATGWRKAALRVDGTTYSSIISVVPISGFGTNMQVVGIIQLAAGQYVELCISQSSGGGALSTVVGSSLSVVKVA